MNERIIELINKLLNKTELNELTWETTSRETEFKVDFYNGSVSTDKWFDAQTLSENIDFKIFNTNGDEIGSWVFESDEEGAKILSNLYETVKRKYLKIDETLDGIFSELG